MGDGAGAGVRLAIQKERDRRNKLEIEIRFIFDCTTKETEGRKATYAIRNIALHMLLWTLNWNR